MTYTKSEIFVVGDLRQGMIGRGLSSVIETSEEGVGSDEEGVQANDE